MRHKIWIGLLSGLGVVLLVFVGLRAPRMKIVDAQPMSSEEASILPPPV